jgi:hypothetical protein
MKGTSQVIINMQDKNEASIAFDLLGEKCPPPSRINQTFKGKDSSALVPVLETN